MLPSTVPGAVLGAQLGPSLARLGGAQLLGPLFKVGCGLMGLVVLVVTGLQRAVLRAMLALCERTDVPLIEPFSPPAYVPGQLFGLEALRPLGEGVGILPICPAGPEGEGSTGHSVSQLTSGFLNS